MKVARSERATCFIVPASLTITRSADAKVVEVALVPPSKRFSSAVVTVAPSNISSSASVIAAEPMVKPSDTKTPVTVTPVQVVSSLLELLKYNLLAPSLLKTANNSDKSLYPKPIVAPLLLNQRFPVPASSI